MVNPAHYDLQSLRVFLVAAESGSLTRTAERTHLTLSAVSKRIAELEKVVSCPLFTRLPRGLSLTPAGSGLLEHARRILNQVNRMASDMSDYAEGVRGHVRMWVNTSAVIQFLPQDLALFLAENPGVRVGLEERLSSTIVEATANGDADIGIFADNIDAPMLEKAVYRHDRLVLLVPPSHPLADLKEIAFADTLQFDYVGLNRGSSLLARLTDAAVAADRPMKLRFQVSSFDAICRMIEAGHGIGVLPEKSVRPEILGAGLRPLRLTDTWALRTLLVGVRSSEDLQPETARLFAFLSSRSAGDAEA